MKKLPRQPEVFDTLELFKAVSREEGLSLDDEQSGDVFVKKFSRRYPLQWLIRQDSTA